MLVTPGRNVSSNVLVTPMGFRSRYRPRAYMSVWIFENSVERHTYLQETINDNLFYTKKMPVQSQP